MTAAAKRIEAHVELCAACSKGAPCRIGAGILAAERAAQRAAQRAGEMALAAERARAAWDGYDTFAEWCAKRGYSGTNTLPPTWVPAGTIALVDDDPEAFGERVRAFAYAIAMEGVYPEDAEPTVQESVTMADIAAAFAQGVRL